LSGRRVAGTRYCDKSKDNGSDSVAAFEATLTAIRAAHAAEVVALREQITAGEAYARQLKRERCVRRERSLANASGRMSFGIGWRARRSS
jgi:hypothetical protein